MERLLQDSLWMRLEYRRRITPSRKPPTLFSKCLQFCAFLLRCRHSESKKSVSLLHGSLDMPRLASADSAPIRIRLYYSF